MLANIKKIFLFINLLNNREFVTRKEVEEFCGITRRSFYRYVNMLSEINIPIYFDKTVRGYRLSTQLTKHQNFDTVNEIIIQTISLIKYSKTMHGDFKEEIDYLIKKVISLSKFSLEEILDAYFNQIRSNNLEIDEETIIKSILIDIAIANSLSMLITYQTSNSSETNSIKVKYPRLEYKTGWLLTDRYNTVILPLNIINHVKIL